jgi:pyruvate carboxylase
MPGTVLKVLVAKGEKVERGDHLMITEAMKMETTVQATFSGIVKDLYVVNGDAIQTGDLLIELSES